MHKPAHPFLCSIFLLFTVIAYSQDFKITVLNKNSQPMPYAYVMINNVTVEVSDTMGVAYIPLVKLADNDTISISYLGASPATIVYDKSLKESKNHCFYLDESGYTLNDVVITYQDFEKLLRKNTKRIPPLNYNCTMNSSFSAKLRDSSQISYQILGTLEATNDRSIEHKYWRWFDPPIKFNTNNDTTGIGRYLDPATHMALFFINISIYMSQVEYKTMKKPFYRYLGEKENLKLFRISFPPGYFTEYYYQFILYVDEKTKTIKKIEADGYNEKSGIGNQSFTFNLQFDCKLFTQKNPKMNPVYLPENIQFTYQIVDQLQFVLKMSEISIK